LNCISRLKIGFIKKKSRHATAAMERKMDVAKLSIRESSTITIK
jgi:hypothetical protein